MSAMIDLSNFSKEFDRFRAGDYLFNGVLHLSVASWSHIDYL